MGNYFIVNLETGKLELHFAKADYNALTDAQQKEVKSNFLWGRKAGCWISRAKEPNLWRAQRCAEGLGLENAGKTGERLSFAEQMARKAARAEHRAERCENRAGAAAQRAEALQAPINAMHGDIAFFTQPNINSSAGRAFTRRREKMLASFEKGFEEFRKSEYWQSRAAIARASAAQKELQDKGFVCRRIAECESSIRKLQKNIRQQEKTISRLEAGKILTNRLGDTLTLERAQNQLDIWFDRLETELDKLGFYQNCLDKLSGARPSPEPQTLTPEEFAARVTGGQRCGSI